MSRIVVAGGPRTGKTTFADAFGKMRGYAVRHTDDLKDLDWSEASRLSAEWFHEPGPWVIEGVTCVRALRKWMAAHPDGAPCDGVVWLKTPVCGLTPGQLTMMKGCATVWREILPELVQRGVEIFSRENPPK